MTMDPSVWGGRACAICGQGASQGNVVGPRVTCLELAAWTSGKQSGQRYADLDPCVDAQACRDRLESRGGTWPIAEGATSRTRPWSAATAESAPETTSGSDEWEVF